LLLKCLTHFLTPVDTSHFSEHVSVICTVFSFRISADASKISISHQGGIFKKRNWREINFSRY